jgi:hypothetical protein
VLKKLNANGSLDVSFANNSEFSERFNSQNDEAIETFAFVNNSKIVFAGRIDSDGNTSSCGIGRVNINACSDFNGIVETQLLKNLINVYPNPQKSGTTISIDISEIEDQFQTWTIQLIDMNGRLILENVQSPVNGLLKLETTQIAPGVYDVAINKSCSKKIIIN